jgi:hypothetical protein
MAVAFRAAGTRVISSTGALVVGMPAGLADRDGLIMVHWTAAQSDMIPPGGWLEIPNTRQTIGSAGAAAAIAQVCYWRRASASETTYRIPPNAGGDWQSAQTFAWSGVETLGDIFDAAAGATAASSTAVSCPAVTTTVANCQISHFIANSTDTSTSQTSAQANAALTSITEQTDENWATGSGGGYSLTTGFKATAGSTGALTATLASASVQALATISLRPDGSLLAPSGFPDVVGRVDKAETADSTSHTIDLPATIAAGQVLLITISSDGNPTITWDNSSAGTWTTVTSVDATACRLYAFHKTADGTEDGATLTFTTSASERLNSSVFLISGASGNIEVQSGFDATGTDWPADHITTLTPTWGVKKTLWFSVAAHDVSGATIFGEPPNYLNTGNVANGATSADAPLLWAYRKADVDSEQPAGFTLSTTRPWAALTIAVEPGSAGYTLTAGAASWAWTPAAVALKAGHREVAAAASWAWTPAAVTLRRNRPLVAAAAAWSWTPAAVTLKLSRRLSAAAASWVWTPQPVALRKSWNPLAANAASWVWSPQAANLRRSLRLSAAAAAWVWTAQDVTLTKVGGATIDAEPAAWAWAPASVALKVSRMLSAAAAAYTWTAQPATLRHAWRLSAAAAAWTWAAQPVTLRLTRRINAQAASWTWTAQAVTLRKSHNALSTQAAAWAWTPQSVSLRLARKLTASAASWTWTAQSVSLVKSGLRLVAEAAVWTWTAAAVDLILKRWGSRDLRQIPVVNNLEQLRKNANAIFRMIQDFLPKYGPALPNVTDVPDGTYFTLTTDQTTYQSQYGAWIAVDGSP